MDDSRVNANNEHIVTNQYGLEHQIECEVAEEGAKCYNDGHCIGQYHQPLNASKVDHLPEDEQRELDDQKDLDDYAEGQGEGHF